MGHQLTEKDEMFSVKETPWHKLGKVIQKAPSVEEGIKLAGLDWEVATKELIIAETGTPVGHKACVRLDTGDTLGVVGPKWTPLQNKEAFGFFDSFIQNDEASLETAGSLQAGGKVWILAKINRDGYDILPNDTINRYILLSDDKAGNGSVRLGFTNIRVVCNNTLTMAHDSQASKLIRIVHSSKVVENLNNVKDVMRIADAEFMATMEQMKRLTTKDINQADIAKFVKMTFFENKMKSLEKEATRTVRDFNRLCDRFEELIETGKGSDIKGVKGTVWGLYNAATEYLTHEAKKNEETRLESLWFGDNKKMNDKVLKAALEMTV